MNKILRSFTLPLVHSWKQVRHFEFWPFWVFYMPALAYGAVLAFKARAVTYFAAANPGLRFGGAFGMSKADALLSLDSAYRPVSILLPIGSTVEDVLDSMQVADLSWPIVVKPDIGERGAQVEVVSNEEELEAWMMEQRYDMLIQEFVDHPVELGVLYYQTLDGSERGITSIVMKEFLAITGDGVSTVNELMRENNRAMYRYDYLATKFADQLDVVLPAGERMELEPIGNHSRGTIFLNGNHLINDELVDVFARIARTIPGFYYGRFDLKVASLEALYRGEGIKVLEINGVNSEPAHIYDPSTTIREAYRDVFRHMQLVYRLARENHKHGAAYASHTEFFFALRNHLIPLDPPIEVMPEPAIPVQEVA